MFKFVVDEQSGGQTDGRMDTGRSFHILKLFTFLDQKYTVLRFSRPVLFSFHYFWHAGVVCLNRFQIDFRAEPVTQLKAKKVFHECRLFE